GAPSRQNSERSTGRPSNRPGAPRRTLAMTAKPETPVVEPSRREFLTTAAAAGGALVLSFYLPPKTAGAASIQEPPWYRDAMVPEINAWLTIAPDDTVTIRVAQTEMGT